MQWFRNTHIWYIMCHSPQVDIIYTNSLKIFDKVDHHRLLGKVNAMGFSEPLIELRKSCLAVRKQYVVFRGAGLYLFTCLSLVYPNGPYLRILRLVICN